MPLATPDVDHLQIHRVATSGEPELSTHRRAIWSTHPGARSDIRKIACVTERLNIR
jgi:hypothetical protein